MFTVETLQKTLGGNTSKLESLLDVQPPNLSDALYAATKRLYQDNAPWIEGFILISTPGTDNTVLTWFAVGLHPLSRGSCVRVS
jgi:hypothetical protein